MNAFDPSQATATHPDSNTLSPLTLCCFGRGGSSLIWHLLGSSPDVWMMTREWHKAVFDGVDPLRRSLRRALRKPASRSLIRQALTLPPPIRQAAWDRVLSDLQTDRIWRRDAARYVGVKLMDHNIWWVDALEADHPAARRIVLTRGPLAQCESLMRSGLSREDAAQWYKDVALAIEPTLPRQTTTIVRFEDFVADPLKTTEMLFNALDIAWPHVFSIKRKPFGAERTEGTDVSRRIYQTFKPGELGQHIDAGVNERGTARLSAEDRAYLLSATEKAAARLGYVEEGSRVA